MKKSNRPLALRDEGSQMLNHPKLFLLYILQFCAVVPLSLFLFYLVSGESYVEAQLHSPWYSYFEWFLGGHFFFSGFEWGYHRYLLHKVIIKWFKSQCIAHTDHHTRTNVTPLKNEYEILDSEQNESATFPIYAPSAFCGAFTPLIWFVQWMFPAQPVMVSCYGAMFFSVVLYEVYHAAMHLDYDIYWKERVEKFHLVRQIYGFHLMHHASIRVNMAIGGFFFLPIWDWLLGTYYVPDGLPGLPLPGRSLPQEIPAPPRRRWLVRRLDELAAIPHKKYAAKEKVSVNGKASD